MMSVISSGCNGSGQAHVNIGMSAHFVYVGMNFLRQQLCQIVDAEVEPKLRGAAHLALGKILDLNLDLIARAYHDEQMRRVFLSFKLDNALMRFARRFTFGLNLVVLLGLMALSVGVLVVLAHDISLIFRGSREAGLAAALGSLLVLWLMIELLDAEIDRLQGGEFKFNLFVGVALVAFIRKVLVASLTHESLQTEAHVPGRHLHPRADLLGGDQGGSEKIRRKGMKRLGEKGKG